MVQPSHTPPNPNRLKPLPVIKYVIYFSDEGQDFLRWHLDAAGQVLRSEPFQTWHWDGRHVMNLRELVKWQRRKENAAAFSQIRVKLEGSGGYVKYPITKIEVLND